MRQLDIAEQDQVAGGLFVGDGGNAIIYQINGPSDSEGSTSGCGQGGTESCAPSLGDVVGGVVSVAAGAATSEMGAVGLLVSGAAAYSASKMPVDPNANNSAAYYRVPNKT